MLASRHCHMRIKYFWQCYVLCGVLLGLCGNQCAAVKYHIGTYLAESCAIDFTQSVNDTVQRALNVLNERSIATSVDFTHTVFSYCDEATALANIEYVFGGSGHDAVIGIATYPFHNSFAAFSDVYKKPYIASNSFVWTHVTDYAFSSSNSYHQTAVVLGQILDYFKWQGVVSITTDDAYWYDLTTELYIQLNLMNFNMKKNVAFKSPLTHEKATRVLSAIETSEKAVILCMNLDDQRTILSAASNLSIGHKHAFFAFARSRYDVTWQSLLSATQGETDSYRTNTANIMESVFVIAAHFPGPEYTFPSRDKRSIDSTEPEQQNTSFEILNRERRNEDPEVTSRRYLSSIFDSVLVLGYAIENYMNQTGQDIDQSVNIINYMKNISFNGSSGFINVDADSTTMYDYHIYDYSIFSGRFEFKIALKSSSPFTWELKLDDEVLWPSNTILSPDTCYKQSSGCDEGGGFQTVYIVILFIAGVVVVVIGIIIFVCVRRVIARNEMKRGPHKLILQPSDLTFLLRKDMGKGSRVMKSSLLDKPDLVKASEPTKSTMSLNELSDYTDTARFNGDLVHVKELKTKGFEMKSSMMDYMKALRDLRHENINPYVGLLVDPVKPALVTEYCSRGSLQDVIRNEDIKLDWDFKYSLVIDLVRGLRYLHNSSLKWHGYLKSTNCVIDSRWVLKLTDYGLPGFLGRAKQIREQDTLDLLWTAPEYLRQEGNQIHKGSEKGDVYSFAIIMQEVALRSDPYSTTGLAPKEIFRKLKKPPPLIRPSVSPQFAPPPYIQLMKQCWSEAPDMRPGVEEIYDQFKKITSGKKANIVDTMFRMLEKYSNDLEEIVNDRTVQLEEEKKKTDQLLSRMLPPAVAEYLKSGKPVEAETFAEVTIYFSDIVGFTTISAMSTPMQVVDLLNDLYTMFDATIEQYDVYKVETIGDAYMVVSGLPTRIGYKHAGEISTMALDLLSQCGTFKIRHMPDVPLRLRIGLHTGSCVAGVVGLTMPRYCLFGDTVNTASRMESTGSAFRIHVSEETKEVLYVLGGYKLEFRGMTDLKGKGKRPTYWLTGKEGFTKPLPDPPDLSADSHGLASVLSSDSLSTMFNNDSTLPATDRPEPILESNEEEANNSMRTSPDQEQTTINFKSKSDQEETTNSKGNSNPNTPKKSSAACSPKPETKNTTKRPNTPKSRPKSSDVKKSTASEIPLKNIVKAEVTVEKRPTEKQSDQNDKLVNDRLVKQKSPQKVKSEHSCSDTSIAKTASSDKSSSSTQSLSDLTKNNTNHNNNNNNNNNAQSNIPASISSTNSYPNIPKTDKYRPRTPSNTGGDKASAEPRKLEIVRGKTGPHGDTKNGKNGPEMQPNHVDDVIKSNPKPQNSPGKHSVKHDINSKSDDAIVNSGEVVNKSCDAVQNNDGDCAEQRRSDVTVVSVLSASDIDINADKLEKSPNDIKLKQQQKKMDSSRLPPITQL